jgi:PLP dependent protein
MLQQILNNLAPTQTQLIAVSKTKPVEAIEDLYAQGQRAFGENYVQEVVEKQPQLPTDIEWHFIGHLQTNKVKYIAPFVHTIHAVDSARLLQEIDKQAVKHNRTIRVLLQFHIAAEDSKFGLDTEGGYFELKIENEKLTLANPQSSTLNPQNTEGGNEWAEIVKILPKLQKTSIGGVMGMATFTDDKAQVRREFQKLKTVFDRLKQTHFAERTDFKDISMGMSDDYLLAIEEGSTMVRVGSLLFGKRVYV